MTLALLSGILLVVFGGITEQLIPLFAVGAFGAFLSSQVGMTRRWLRRRGPHFRKKLLVNASGALGTLLALGIIVCVKFTEGAWVTLLVLPAMYLLLRGIHVYYKRLRRQVDRPAELSLDGRRPPVVVVPVAGWNCVSEHAVRFAIGLSRDVIAPHVATERDDVGKLRRLWEDDVEAPSPFRLLYDPILSFITRIKGENPDRTVAVVIPEVVSKRWYLFLLHNQHGNGLKARLYLGGDDRRVVISIP